MSEQMVQRIALKAVIVSSDGKALVVREATTYDEGTQHGRYQMPGGRLEIGENFEDGLRREVKEEVGLEILLEKPLYMNEWRPVIKGVPHQIVAVFVICRPVSEEIRLSDEHDDYQWVDPNDYDDLDIMEPYDEVLKHLAAWQANQ